MDELIAANRDADVRRTAALRFEEQQVSGLHVTEIDLLTRVVLPAHLARQADAILREDPLHKPAAIEPRRVAAAVAIGNTPESHRRRDDGSGCDRCGRHDNGWPDWSRRRGRPW